MSCKINEEAIPLDATDWLYHGEGNKNMVFAYTGSSVQELNGWLLRLTKSDSDNDSSQDKRDEITYTNKVIGRLVGAEYILAHRLVKVDAAFVKELHNQSLSHRPQHRQHKCLNPRQTIGILIPDMRPTSIRNGGPAVTVEIKPKWGFLPTSSHIASQNIVKHTVCRYCMHQYLKHRADNVSSFCPLGLYSGSRDRIVRALADLSESPQNNLRVFTNGVEDQQLSKSSKFQHVVTDIILAEQLFPRLQKLQRQLDSLDIEGIMPMYERGLKTTTSLEIEDWLESCRIFKQRLSSNQSVAKFGDKQAVLEFMISVTLKDISVLITIPDWPNNEETCIEPLPEYKIAIIDTDQKKVAKIPEYYKKDQTIVATYLQYNNTTSKSCCP